MIIKTTFIVAQDDIEKMVIKIRGDFNSIELNLKNCHKKLYTYIDKNGFKTNYEAYYMPYGRLVKLVEFSNAQKKEIRSEYYCKENAVFFLFIEEKSADGKHSQRRIYFDESYKVIRDLYKEKAINDKTDFSKIANVNSDVKWPDLEKVDGHSFYGNQAFNNYFRYPVFENVIDKESKIKKIKEEYSRIESLRKTGELQAYNIAYLDSIAYWNNTHYTALYDDQSKLVLLTYGIGEEGYYSENEIFFKDRKPFFAYSQSRDADDRQSQERIYIYNDQIVEALVKLKSPEDTREFSEIKNAEKTDLLKDLNRSSSNIIGWIEDELARLFIGFESQDSNQ